MKPVSSGKKVFITGAGGFVGANLTRRLLSLNYDVHVLWKRSSNPWRIEDIKNQITLHDINLLSKNSVSSVLNKIQPMAIIHLATYSSYRNQEDIEEIVNISINGTLNLLLASKNIPYEIFVNTGSSSEYGFKEKPMKETDLLEPISFYASSKAGQTVLCQAFSFEYKKPIVTIRPFSVYGPYEQEDRFIPTIIRSLIAKKEIKLTQGSQRRDFIYVDDLVDIYVKALEKKELLKGKILNAGTGKQYSNDEIVKTLFKISGIRVPIEKGKFPKRIWDSPNWISDTKNVKKSLNWKPKYSLEKGLRNTYDWFLKNNSLYESR